MRTTLDIDPKLLEEVVKFTGAKGKSKAVQKALEEYLRHDRTRRLLGAPGRITLADDWDIWRGTELGRLREVKLDEQPNS